MNRVFLIALCLLLFSCTNNAIPKDVLKQKEMQQVYWDLIRADNLSKEIIRRDSSKKLDAVNVDYVNKVLAIHNLSKEALDRSLNFYNKHPDLLEAIFDSIQLDQSKVHYQPWITPVKKQYNNDAK
ncbi:MAG: hypothetical protein NVS3B19_02270 [Ginsengibacter sp.]